MAATSMRIALSTNISDNVIAIVLLLLLLIMQDAKGKVDL